MGVESAEFRGRYPSLGEAAEGADERTEGFAERVQALGGVPLPSGKGPEEHAPVEPSLEDGTLVREESTN